MVQTRVVFCWAVSLLYASAAQPPPVAAQQKPQPPEQSLKDCGAVLERAVAALQNVDIEFTVNVDWRIPNLPRMTGESGHIYLDDGKMYFRFNRTFPPLPGRPHVVELEEIAYDGNTYYLGKNSEGATPSIKTMLGVNPNSAQAWQNFIRTCLYLEVAGYRLPRKVAHLRGGKLTSVVLDCLKEGEVNRVTTDHGTSSLVVSVTIPDPVVLDAKTTDLDLFAKEMEQNNSSPREIEKRIGELTRLRTSDRKRRVDLWLDPGKGYSMVRRVESTLDGKLIYEIKATDFKQFGKAGVWLPENGTIKTFVRDTRFAAGFQSEPNRTDVVHLEHVSFEPRKDISFVLDYGPGTTIVDRSSEAAKSSSSGEIVYVEPGSPDELRHAAEAIRPGHWLLVVNVILFVLFVGGLVIWRIRSPSAV
jgi:hypothetical protein